MVDLAQRLTDAAVEAVHTSKPRAFDAAVERFTAALQTIPDYPAAELSNEGFARINSFAEQVISEIEHRLEGDMDARRRETLGTRVYDIRRALEDAFNWRRHYLRT